MCCKSDVIERAIVNWEKERITSEELLRAVAMAQPQYLAEVWDHILTHEEMCVTLDDDDIEKYTEVRRGQTQRAA